MSTDIRESVERELKECELNMLKCFVSVCDELKLNYFLVGGTLIGAIRHKGFIPWDDDIDVGMLREDYEVFLREAPKLLPEYYFLQTMETDPEFPHNFAKIRDCRTTFIETTVCKYNMNHGVFIDVFAFDYYPENKQKAKVLEFKKKYLKARIDLGFCYDTEIKHSFLGKVMIALGKIQYPDIKKALRARDRLYKSVPKSRLVTNYSGIWGSREIVPIKWVKSTCKVSFEDFTVKAPKYYKEYLTNLYGDYMKLPPVEQQVGHHYTEVMDLSQPYTVYRK